MKNERQDKILEMVEKYNIETQEELIYRLSLLGFEVTQATISRDIRDLKLTKIMTPRGVYKYVLPKNYDGSNFRFKSALSESITKVDWALNQIVIKTYPGMAQAVATGVDTMDNAGILGCVAGDDTIMVVTREEELAESIAKKIKYLIKSV